MSSITVTLESNNATRFCEISVSPESPWSRYFGSGSHPVAGSIDVLDQFMGSATTIERVSVIGHPPSCLLPIVWLNSIWKSEHGYAVRLRWESDQSTQPDEVPASRLACLLADEVEVGTNASIPAGFDPSQPGVQQDAFDLLINITDAWDPNLRSALLGDDWVSEMRDAISRCAANGLRRIGVYGAGTHTRAVGEAFMDPPVEICCIIDDDHRRHGKRLWGFPIVSPDDALQLKLDAVVLSANSIENLLWERSAKFREQGIQVISLYGSEEMTQEVPDAVGT